MKEKETIITEAYISHKDDKCTIIDWTGNVGFGQLTFTHEDGCEITVDAECMNIDTIVKIMKQLKD